MKRGGGSDEDILVTNEEQMDFRLQGEEGDGRRNGTGAGAGEQHLSLPPSSTVSSRRASGSSTVSSSLPNKIGNTARSSSEEVTIPSCCCSSCSYCSCCSSCCS